MLAAVDFWTMFFSTLPATLAAIAAMIVSIRNGWKVEEVRHATNSMKDELVEATRKGATAVGHAQGVTDEKAASAKSRYDSSQSDISSP